MADHKTYTEVCVDDYLEAVEDEGRRKGCRALAELMTKATKQQPKMWGAGMVGLESCHF